MEATHSNIPATSADGPSTLVRMPMVIKITGLGRSTIYRLMAENLFPCQVKIAKRAVAWRQADLELWSKMRQPVPH
ncbi:AlpA family transcriptional regulator [Paucibacter sp. KBW04]|nr:AlpA family transcriptional regulator [Paucibacter sp. KBW04]